MIDTQWTQSAQNVDYYVPANSSHTAMIHEPQTQPTETTQRDLCLEDFIGWDEMASHSNLRHTGPSNQPQYGGDGSRGMDPTLDNFHPTENIPNNHVYRSADTSHDNSRQQPADTMASHGRMILSQDGNHQLNIKLRHNDTVSFTSLPYPIIKGQCMFFNSSVLRIWHQ